MVSRMRSRSTDGFAWSAVLIALTATIGACDSDRSAPGTADASLPEVVASTTSTIAATTTQPATPESAAVRAAVAAYWAASQACGQRPTACEPESFTAGTGPLRSVVEAYREQLIENGYYLGEPEPDSGAYVDVRSVLLDPTRTSAATSECVYDPTPLFGPTGRDGEPTVVNDFFATRYVVHTFTLQDGEWLASEEQHPDVSTDTDPCGDVPGTVPPAFNQP